VDGSWVSATGSGFLFRLKVTRHTPEQNLAVFRFPSKGLSQFSQITFMLHIFRRQILSH
jgi:hypothetical protein